MKRLNTLAMAVAAVTISCTGEVTNPRPSD